MLLLVATCASLFAMVKAVPLECWHCVGLDCGSVPMAESKFAYKQTCEEGAVCQKTIYHIMDFDLTTNATSATLPIYSCSWNYGCEEVNEFANATFCDHFWHTQIGCQERYCCNTDLCNSSLCLKGVVFKVILSTMMALFAVKQFTN